MFVVVFSLLLPFSVVSRRDSIFCLIHTATPSHDTRAETIYNTWAKRCDDFLFFTNSPMRDEIPHIYWPELSTRDHSWQKIRKVMAILAGGKKYDWYLRADDDAYVVLENMRAFLKQFNASEAHYLGYKWNFFVTHGYADGGAYVLSYPTLTAFAELMKDPRCPEHHRAEEDQELAKCLEKVGIYPANTRDLFGSDRFHHFHISEHLTIDRDPFVRTYAYYQPLPGIENFSPQMVSFHHVSPYEMRIIDFILYQLKRDYFPSLPKLS